MVSIITPSYNSSRFIRQTINSVLAQTYKNWEMLIVDDCSTDKTNEIISHYAEKDSRIKHIKLSMNSGPALARNAALSVACGNYVAFLDSDDVWYPDKLKDQIFFMKKNGYTISCTSYKIIDQFDNETGKEIKVLKELNLKSYLKDTRVGFSTVIIDKRKTGEFKMMNIPTRQDGQLLISLLRKGYSIHGLNITYAQYRVHSNSISSNKIITIIQMWKLYYEIENFGFIKSIYYLFCYLINAIRKRL